MDQIERITRKKWIAIIVFLVIDVLQILFVSVLYFDESTPWIIGFDPSQNNPLISISLFLGIGILQLIMLYYYSLNMLSGKAMREIFPTYDEELPWDGRYSKENLVKWSHEISEKSGVRIKRIYVMQSPLPNAFTFSLPFVGSILVLYSNIMDLLNEDEVQAIIAHEIGHIKNRDSLVSIFSQMPSFFVDIIYLYIYVRLILGVATALVVDLDFLVAGLRIIIFFAFFIFSRVIVTITQVVIQGSSRKAELLSDYHAAEIVGTIPTLNALIRLGQRVEAITALTETIKWLESLNPERVNPITRPELNRMILAYPLDGIDEKNAETKAPWVYLFTKLKHLREIYGVKFSDQQIIDAITPAVKTLVEKRIGDDSETDEEPTSRVVDWRIVDSDGDSRLSRDEITELVRMLRNNPSKLMFDSEVDNNLLLLAHPDFRRRVLFIADTCEI